MIQCNLTALDGQVQSMELAWQKGRGVLIVDSSSSGSAKLQMYGSVIVFAGNSPPAWDGTSFELTSGTWEFWAEGPHLNIAASVPTTGTIAAGVRLLRQ